MTFTDHAPCQQGSLQLHMPFQGCETKEMRLCTHCPHAHGNSPYHQKHSFQRDKALCLVKFGIHTVQIQESQYVYKLKSVTQLVEWQIHCDLKHVHKLCSFWHIS
jgi:hypothetical protein